MACRAACRLASACCSKLRSGTPLLPQTAAAAAAWRHLPARWGPAAALQRDRAGAACCLSRLAAAGGCWVRRRQHLLLQRQHCPQHQRPACWLQTWRRVCCGQRLLLLHTAAQQHAGMSELCPCAWRALCHQRRPCHHLRCCCRMPLLLLRQRPCCRWSAALA